MVENYLERQISNNNELKITSEELFHVLGKRWSLPVIRALAKNNAMGFNQIKNHFQKITPTTLSSVMKSLEQYGIITKKIHVDLLSSVSYSLTSYGKILNEISFILEKIPNDVSDDYSSSVDIQNEGMEQIRNISGLVKRISKNYASLKNNVTKYFVPMAALCGASSGLCVISEYVSDSATLF
jgi:DNA-binding HxlR family transcriptional regulator